MFLLSDDEINQFKPHLHNRLDSVSVIGEGVISVDLIDVFLLQILAKSKAVEATEVTVGPAHVDEADQCEGNHKGHHANEDKEPN